MALLGLSLDSDARVSFSKELLMLVIGVATGLSIGGFTIVLIFMNPAVTLDDVDILLDLITRHSEAAWRSSNASEPLREPTPLA